jgi:hypothetical protein
MTRATIRSEINEALDRHRDRAAKITFHDTRLVDDLTERVDVVAVQIASFFVLVHAGLGDNLRRGALTDAENRRQRDIDTLSVGQIDACNTSHTESPGLSLTLLVLFGGANHADDTLASHDFALVTNRFHTCSDFHFSTPYLKITNLLATIHNAAAGQVVGRDLELDLVSGENANKVHSHLSANRRENHVPVLKLHAKHRVRQRFADDSFDLDDIFLGHAPFSIRQSNNTNGPDGRATPTRW